MMLNKISTKQINQLFGPNEFALIESVELMDQAIQCQLFVQPEIKWFKGHFPDQPILAGVVQTHWAVELSNFVFEQQQGFERISNLKFKSLIIPEIKLSLMIKFNLNTSVSAFVYRGTEDSKIYSQGQIHYSE